MESEHQIPIWFFIGVLILIYGIIIACAGVYAYFSPPPLAERVVLFEYHADIWWGLLLIAIGTFYTLRFRPDGTQE